MWSYVIVNFSKTHDIADENYKSLFKLGLLQLLLEGNNDKLSWSYDRYF